MVCAPLSCAAHTRSSAPAPSSPPQGENARAYLERKRRFLKKPLTLSVHIFMPGRNAILFFSWTYHLILAIHPPRNTGRTFLCPRRGGRLPAGSPAGPPAPGVPPPRRAPQAPRAPADGAEPTADSAGPGWYRSSAWRSRINQRFGLVFSYYGQYIKGIYLRKCLSCQSFPMSSILNTPYNY